MPFPYFKKENLHIISLHGFMVSFCILVLQSPLGLS